MKMETELQSNESRSGLMIRFKAFYLNVLSTKELAGSDQSGSEQRQRVGEAVTVRLYQYLLLSFFKSACTSIYKFQRNSNTRFSCLQRQL